MPKESKNEVEIPASFLGEYLEIHFKENAIRGYFKTISKTSDRKYLIESKEVIFLDSLNWVKQNRSPIRQVNVENNSLEIITDGATYKQELADTLSGKPKHKEYEIDLKEHYFYYTFKGKEEYGVSKLNCQLRLKNEKHYLNIEYFDNYWMIARITKSGKNLILNTTNFSLEDDEKIRFDQLKSKYGFEKIELEEKRGLDWEYFLAKSDNNEMESILDEEFFEEIVWHRINEKSSTWIWIATGIIMLIALIAYFRKPF